MVNYNTLGAIIVAHISKDFIYFASGSISSLNTELPLEITQGLRLEPGVRTGAKIVEGCVISNEI